MKRLLSLALLIVIVGGVVYWYRATIRRSLFQPTPAAVTVGVQAIVSPTPQADVTVVAQDLAIPWEVVFPPTDHSILVTERPGRLVHITPDKNVIPVSGVKHIGEGGLLGLALHPRFADNQWLYLYLTTGRGSGTINRVERYRLAGEALVDRQIILDAIPGAVYHDGGRIAFGPDGALYIATGDATQESLAQDKNSLAGKILRLNDDGSLPPDNPFATAVYSYGHRNVQGLAWDDRGQLWATEHGPSGVASGFDELNVIEPGKNYGWPVIKGDETRAGMEKPVIHSGAADTWAPSGAAFWDGSIFFSGLRGEALFEARLRQGFGGQARPDVTLIQHLRGQFGRLRAVVVGPDGQLYITTSNTDGRGTPQAGDDKVLRLSPDLFRK